SQQLSNMKRLYSDEILGKRECLNEDSFEYQDSLDFNVHYFDSLTSLYRKVGAHLSKLHSEKSTRALVCLQSAYPKRLQKLVRITKDFPIVEIRSSGTLPM